MNCQSLFYAKNKKNLTLDKVHFSTKNYRCFSYISMKTEALLLSTHNMFPWEIPVRILLSGYSLLSEAMKNILTLKTLRKPASENVVCFCCLLKFSCKLFKPIFAYRQTVWTQIRLLLEEQSDLGPHCLQKWLLKSQADDKADDNSCDWQFKS